MQTQEHKIRLAEEYDIRYIVGVLCKKMLVEEYNAPHLYDEDTQANLVYCSVKSRTCWVTEVDGKLTGVIVSLPSPHIYNSKLMSLSELVWYVLPEHRNSRAALLLLNAFTKESDNYDVSSFSILPSSNVQLKALLKRGFNMKEFGLMRSKWQP
jgi:Acetyltransferase (GNAT) family